MSSRTFCKISWRKFSAANGLSFAMYTTIWFNDRFAVFVHSTLYSPAVSLVLSNVSIPVLAVRVR